MLLDVVVAIGVIWLRFGLLDAFSRFIMTKMTYISLDATLTRPVLFSKGFKSADINGLGSQHWDILTRSQVIC